MIMIREERFMHTTKLGKSLFFNGKGFYYNKSTGWPRSWCLANQVTSWHMVLSDAISEDGEEEEEQRRIIIGIWHKSFII